MDELEKYEFNRNKIYYDRVSNSYKVGTNPYNDYTKNQLYELFYNHPDDWKFLYGRGNVFERNRTFSLFDEIDYKHLYMFCIEEQGNEDYINYIMKKYKYKINYDAFIKDENNYRDYIFRYYTSKNNKKNIEVYKFIRFLTSTLYNKEFINYLHKNSINQFFIN